VKCDRFREAASARLDGEPIGMATSALDHHLNACVDCARWIEDAVRLTRQARLGTSRVPDLCDTILAEAVLPARRVLRRRNWLRVALAAVGAAQLAMTVPSLFGTSIGMAMSVHAVHESAAWNSALGVALLACAAKPRRASGIVLVLGTFVGVLTLLSIRDVAGGYVAASRLATHTCAVLGFGLVAALARAERALPPVRDVGGEGEQGGSNRLRGVA
jgi:predicted anti-sigma-YlaC factor YlaD